MYKGLVLSAILNFISIPLYADGLYLDVGLGVHSNYLDNSSHQDNKSSVYMENPIGVILLGYKYKDTNFFILHASSIPDKHDNGFNMLTITTPLYGN